MTLHPLAGKQGVNIDRSKYDTVRQAIEETLQPCSRGLPSAKLTARVLERVDGRSPQRLRS